MTAPRDAGVTGTVAPRPPFASLGARGAAAVVDLAVMAALEWPVAGFVHGTGFASQVMVQLLPTLYLVLCWSAPGGGRTLGKRLFRSRVARADGGPLTLAMALRRWFVAAGVLWPLWWLRPTGAALAMPPAIVGWGVCTLVLSVLAVDTWLLLFTLPSRQSLHDRVAGSVVVRRDAVAPFATATASGGVMVATLVLVALSAMVTFPAWRWASAVAPRAVELQRATSALRADTNLLRASAWPAFEVRNGDTTWRVTVFAEYRAAHAAGVTTDDAAHRIACALARAAPRSAGRGEVAAITLNTGGPPSGVLFAREDLTEAACAAP